MDEMGKTADEGRQILPDGIGLTVDEVRALLVKEHDVAVPKDDPALMYVTIMNAALTEEAKLQRAHREALGRMMGEHTKNYVQGTEAGMREVMATLSKLTAEGLNEAARDMVKYRQALFYCTAIVAMSMLINVAVFILGAAR